MTLRQLARDLCVSHAAPSRHFKDRQSLIDALAVSGFDRLCEALAESTNAPAAPFADRLRAFARAYVAFATENAALLDIMYAAKHDPAASTEVITAGQRMMHLVMALIADGQSTGDVRQDPIERVGLPLFSTLHGFIDLATSNVIPAPDIESALDDIISYALRGCARIRAVRSLASLKNEFSESQRRFRPKEGVGEDSVRVQGGVQLDAGALAAPRPRPRR